MNNAMVRLFFTFIAMTVCGFNINAQEKYLFPARDTLTANRFEIMPYISVQQMIKGSFAGIYVQENNGEPGTVQRMLIRGRMGAQPAVYVNGIPLITDDTYLYGVRLDGSTPVGSATNWFAGLDINNIVGIEVIKDPVKLARLGPVASGGAIVISTKDNYFAGDEICISGMMGFAAPPSGVKMTNGADELVFRKRFYDAYNIDMKPYLPDYLKNDRDEYYFGTSDWADEYYQYGALYNLSASVKGGNSVADYSIRGSYSNNGGIADETGLTKYNFGFGVNIRPLKGLLFSSLVNINQAGRQRNNNVLERYAEVEYMPELITPPAPTQQGYKTYTDAMQLKKDDNINNLIFGKLLMSYKTDRLYADAQLQLNYGRNNRKVFYPSTMMESVSYASDFWERNRRMNINGKIGYLLDIKENSRFNAELFGSVQQDFHHYDYIRAFDGADDLKPSTSSGNFAFLYRYSDEMDYRLASSGVALDYSYADKVKITGVLRYDGSSAAQKDRRWILSPAATIEWNILKNLSVTASGARRGKLFDTDRYMSGPYYNSENINWKGQPLLPSYYGMSAITRPYSAGWSDYGFGWAYSDDYEVGISASMLDSRIHANLAVYSNTDRDMVARIPVAREFGYEYKYLNGMDVNNRGVEWTASAAILSNPKGLNWDVCLNLAYNRSELKKLPQEAESLTWEDRKLVVGEAIDRFWVYRNKGIYTTESEIPERLTYKGVALQVGDPVREDINNDNIVNEDDKVLTGHSTPPMTGGLESRFRFGRFDAGINLYFAIGHNVLNYRASQRYNFVAQNEGRSLTSAKEIFFWQDAFDNQGYPLYNPLSYAEPYSSDQDLFLEKASYLKLGSINIGYTFPLRHSSNKLLVVKGLYLFMSLNNLFTVSSFSGDDPELTDSDGYYRGYSQIIPRMMTLGFKVNF
jgi:hypothetical protein